MSYSASTVARSGRMLASGVAQPLGRLFLAVMVMVSGSWLVDALADPGNPPMHDPDERQRFRRELRQAHRERVMAGQSATPPVSGTVAPDPDAHRPDIDRLRRYSDRFMHPDPASMRPDNLRPQRSSEPPEAIPGTMPLSDEERIQLRRQIREQRSARRAGPPLAPTTPAPGHEAREN